MKKLYLIVLVMLLLSKAQVLAQCAITISTSTNSTQLNCTNTAITLTAIPDNFGTGILTYSWNAGLGGENVVTITDSGTYTVIMTYTENDTVRCISSSSIIISKDNIAPDVIVLAFPDTICNGQSTTMVALGADTYLWQADNSTGAVNSPSPTETTTYNVTGTGVNGCPAEDSITIQVINQSVLDHSDHSYYPCPNDPVTLTAELTNGGEPISLQWYKGDNVNNGIIIPGATGISYDPPTGITGTSNYYCVLYGYCNTDASGIFTVAVGTTPPGIISQPSTSSQVLCLNEQASQLSVTPNRAGLNYQWYSTTQAGGSDATAIVDSTNRTYTPSSNAAGTFYYYCVVSDINQCTFDSMFVFSNLSGAITFTDTTKITAQSTGSQTRCLNDAFLTQLSVTASGIGLTYQWYKNTDPGYSNATIISDSTDSTYTPQSTIPGMLYYFCIATGSCLPADTSDISGAITITDVTKINAQSVPAQTLCLNAIANPLSVTAVGGGLNYQWYKNTESSYDGGRVIENATGSSYTPSTITDTTFYYYCIVNGDCSLPDTSDISGAIKIAVPAVIVSQSTNGQTLCLNATTTPVSVAATGTGLTYQWYKNSDSSYESATLISDATDSFYTPSSALADTLYYFCLVSGSCLPADTSDISGAFIVNRLPVPSIGVTVSVCQNSTPPPPVWFTGSDGTGSYAGPHTFEYTINGLPQSMPVISTQGNDTGFVEVSTVTPGIFNYNLISVTDNNGCTQTETQNLIATVTVNPLPAASIGGAVTVCKNSTAPKISFAGLYGTGPYTFSYNINDLPETTTASMPGNDTGFVDVPTSTPGIFNFNLLSVTDNNGCTQMQTQNLTATVTVSPLPTAIIAGTDTVCQNSAQPKISFAGLDGTGPYVFAYNINGGDTIRTASTSNDSGFVNRSTDFTGVFSYNLKSVKDINGCTQRQSGTAIITVFKKPELAEKTLKVCDTVNYTAINPDALTPTTFSWTRAAIPGRISNNAASDTTAVIAEVVTNITDSALSVPYIFTLSTGSGCIVTELLNVTVNARPVIEHINDTFYCNGAIVLDGIPLKTKSFPDPEFTWVSDKLVGFGTSGTTTNSISAFIAANSGAAPLVANVTVNITVDNTLKCRGLFPEVFTITVNPSATTPGFSWLNLRDSTLCSGANNINFNVKSTADSTLYVWSSTPPDANVIIKDANSANTVVSFNNTGTYTIKVFATNQIGGCSESVSQTVSVINTGGIAERKIFLKKPGNILIYPDNSMDAVNGYQWGYDSVITDAPDYSFGPPTAIAGQVYQFFTPDSSKFFDNGILDTTTYKYWVLLQKGGCYTKVYYNGPYAGRPIAVPTPEDNSVRLKVFPNPNNGIFNIELKGNIYGKIDAKIYNAVGQIVFIKQFLKTSPEVYESLEKNNLPNGLYYLMLSSSDLKKAVTRFIIQH